MMKTRAQFSLTSKGLAVLVLILSGVSSSVALAKDSQPALADRPEYQAALLALDEKLPQAAAVKFERMLKDKSLTHAEALKVSARLADALARSRQPEKLLMVLTFYEVPDALYWKAQALLLAGKYRESEATFRTYIDSPNPAFGVLAKLSLGQVIFAENRENTGRKFFKEQADSNVDPIISHRAQLWMMESEIFSGRSEMVLRRLENSDRENPELEFVRASALIETGEAGSAVPILRKLLEGGKKLDHRLHDAVVLHLANALETTGRVRSAEKLLQRFIKESEFSPFFDQAFASLDRVKSAEDGVTVARYKSMAEAKDLPERRSYAMFYHAKWLAQEGKSDVALKELEEFRAFAPGHPRASESMRLLMAIHGAMHNDDRVLELAREWRARYGSGGEDIVDFLTGMIRFSRSEYADAAALFQRSADAAGNIMLKQRALYNMGISALKGALPAEYSRAVSQLQLPSDAGTDANTAPPVTTVAADLIIARALHLAAIRGAGAEDALREFIKSYPDHSQWMVAQIALAEYCLLDLPPRVKTAQTSLDAAATSKDKSPEWRERLDYARVWLREAEENFSGVAEEGLKFIQSWPKSSHRDEVRMKIAQAYYRLEDFPKARAQFELVEDEHAESPFAEVAQFFAAKSAMSTLNAKDLDKALDLFKDVVIRGGPLAIEARRQQALIKRLQGNEADALIVIESLLTAKPPPEGDSLVSMLIEKGELLALQIRQDPKKLEEAATVFRSVTQYAAASRFWRIRAGVLLAQSLQRLGKSDEAIEACHDVLETCLAANLSQQLTLQEHTWLYRAGFMAIEILESQKQWDSAARIADRLAQTSGERAKEAKDRATRIRLEHFLWDK